VVDFFDFRIWPIFNVADIAICIGVACIMYALWNDKR
ncbi:signal peptidase II, partial [uncultured Veillonella sp.]